MKRRYVKWVFWGLSFLLVGPSTLQANLLISPTRIFFDSRERTKKVILKNTSSQKKSYKIFFKHLWMDELGSYVEIPSSKFINSAIPYVRYSPRIITLPPGQSQTIRLLLRRKKGMDLQEYRSHLAFKELPPEGFGNVIGADKTKSTFTLVTLFEVTIPLLISNGPESYNVNINGLELLQDEESNKLRVVLNRAGKTSAYGNIRVKYQAPGSSDLKTIGRINRFFVYFPSPKRQIDIPLELSKEINLGEGILQVFFNKIKSKGGDLVAFASLNLN